MLRRGIDGLICLDRQNNQIVIKKNLVGFKNQPNWKENIWLDSINEFDALINGNGNLHEILIKMDFEKKITFMKVISFRIHNKVIKVNDLYPGQDGKSGYNACFLVDQNNKSLITMPSRTDEELITIGSNTDSEVPFIITDTNFGEKPKLVSVNF